VKIRDLSYIVFHSVLLCAVVLLIIGISTGFGQIITLAQIPQKLAAAVLSVTTSKVIIILAINILLLFVGCIMETNAAIISLVPIMLPIVQQLQMSFVHFGLIVIMNLFIGFVTPPFGADLFMTCQVGGVKFEALCKAIVPWILVMLVALVLVVIVPDISLFLPKLLGRTI
jgi:C4-dicarboxylate transporter DctM subunit